MIKPNEINIQRALNAAFSNYNYTLFNTFVYAWESDYFGISSSGYSLEIEIKITKSDFKADYKKKIVRAGYENGQHIDKTKTKHDLLIDDDYKRKPNKFYFACPEDLIKLEDINPRYGLIYVKNMHCRIIRSAKFLHKEKMLEDKFYTKKLLNKFYYRNIDLRIAMGIREYDLKYGQKRLDDPCRY